MSTHIGSEIGMSRVMYRMNRALPDYIEHYEENSEEVTDAAYGDEPTGC